jgi:hypothetical protein
MQRRQDTLHLLARHQTWSYSVANIAWKNISHGFSGVFALALAQLSAAPARAADYDVGAIPIAKPWARVTAKGAS